MDIVTEIGEKVKDIFSKERLDALAKESGFIKRKRKIVAEDFLFHHLYLGLDKNSSIEDIAYGSLNLYVSG